MQGVFARESIPMRRSRILFEYRSEHQYGTTDANKVDGYLRCPSDNKYVVNIGNVIVDATRNVSSCCNFVQELLNHNNGFNGKYVKVGDVINIVQIAPIAQYEELNMQYSERGEFRKNRTIGYQEQILVRARKY